MLQKCGNHKGAVKRFKRFLKQSPNHPQILNSCAISLAELDDVNMAEKLLGRAVKSDPDHAESWHNLGVLLQKSGKLDAVADANTHLRTLNPDTSLGHVKFADACYDMERYGDAMTAYEQALTLDPPGRSECMARAFTCQHV